MEKKRKEKKRNNTKSNDELIDGLPLLRGMFVCPESLIDNHIPPIIDLVLSEQKFSNQDHSLQEEKNWGINWVGQD